MRLGGSADNGFHASTEECPGIKDLAGMKHRMPAPIALAIKRMLDVDDDKPKEKVSQLLKLGEVTTRLLAIVAALLVKREGLRDDHFDEQMSKLQRPSFGIWCDLLEESLKSLASRDIREIVNDLVQDVSIRVPDNEGRVREALGMLERFAKTNARKGGVTVLQLLRAQVTLRNQMAHNLELSDGVCSDLLAPVSDLVAWTLAQIRFLENYILVDVDSAVVDGGSMTNKGRAWIGTENARIKFVSEQALEKTHAYFVRIDDRQRAQFSLDLEPFGLSGKCSVCQTLQLFIYTTTDSKHLQYTGDCCSHPYLLSKNKEAGTSIFEMFLRSRVGRTETAVQGRGVGSGGDILSDKRKRSARALISSAEAFLDRPQPDVGRAIPCLESALEIDADASEGHFLLGVARCLEGQDCRHGLESLERARRLGPDHFAVRHILAIIYSNQGEQATAIGLVEEALSLQPSSTRLRKMWEELKSPTLGENADLRDRAVVEHEKVRRSIADAFAARNENRIELRYWPEWVVPWVFLRSHPAIGATTITALLAILAIILHRDELYSSRIWQIGSILVICWLGLFLPFMGPKVFERAFQKLLPVVTMPHDVFRRFYVRQCGIVLGPGCITPRGAPDDRFIETIGKNWKQAGAALLFFLLILPFQYVCANDEFNFRAPTLYRYFLYTLEAYLFSWVIQMPLSGYFFIPDFADLPQKFYVGMPETVSLKPLGDVFIKFSYLGSTFISVSVLQHYAFRTYATSPVFSILYNIITIGILVSTMILPQFVIKTSLLRLRDRKLTEYGYKVEQAHERYIQSSDPRDLEVLRQHCKFQEDILRVDIRSFSSVGRILFLGLVAWFALVLGVYLYLIRSNVWLI